MKRRARMMAMGMLKRSKGHPFMRELIAVVDVPSAAVNLALMVDEVGIQMVFAT